MGSEHKCKISGRTCVFKGWTPHWNAWVDGALVPRRWGDLESAIRDVTEAIREGKIRR